MTDHLPECKAVPEDSDLRWCTCKTHLPECPILASPENAVCFCRALRACEQRVEESMDRAWTQTVKLAEAHARVSGYAAGVQAARDAVHRMDWMYDEGCANHVVQVDDALAAIDALRGEPL